MDPNYTSSSSAFDANSSAHLNSNNPFAASHLDSSSLNSSSLPDYSAANTTGYGNTMSSGNTLNSQNAFSSGNNLGSGNTLSSGDALGTANTTSADAHPVIDDNVASKASATFQNAKDTVIAGAHNAAEKIQANPTYQQITSGKNRLIGISFIRPKKLIMNRSSRTEHPGSGQLDII